VSRKPVLALLAALAVLGAVAWGWSAWTAREEEEHRAARAAELTARATERDERLERLRAESVELMPAMLRPVALGMTRDEVRALRAPRITPSANTGHPLMLMEERLANGGQVVYGFARAAPNHLLQVQVLSILPTRHAIAPHLAAMNEQYGTPTGVWDCPTTGDVPTRRFTWRRSYSAVSDVFLVYGDRVSLTLYIATSEQIGRSLAMASCTAVTRESLERFPVATQEQLEAAQRSSR
jgi:hypothetical protein